VAAAIFLYFKSNADDAIHWLLLFRGLISFHSIEGYSREGSVSQWIHKPSQMNFQNAWESVVLWECTLSSSVCMSLTRSLTAVIVKGHEIIFLRTFRRITAKQQNSHATWFAVFGTSVQKIHHRLGVTSNDGSAEHVPTIYQWPIWVST